MRTDAREFAFKMIFEKLFKDGDEALSFNAISEDKALNEVDLRFYEELFNSFKENQDEIEAIIKSNCEGYDLDRIYKVDLALLYLAAVELKFIKTPPQVVINEVLNISKKYSTDKSGSFINGVLSKVVKALW